MSRFNPKVFDTHIDREFSAFTSAEIPDPKPLSTGENWMSAYILNSFLRGRFTGRGHQLVMGLIWPAQLCVQHFGAARVETLEYVDGHDPGQPKLGTYFRALAEWEAFSINAMLAIGYSKQFALNNSQAPEFAA